MRTVSVSTAKACLSRLLDQVENGDAFIITRNGRPVAKLTSIKRPQSLRKLGGLRGRIKINHDFDAPLPADLWS